MAILLNHQQRLSLEGVDVNTTLLQFLRSNAFSGTKEGCAAGDCGACTVVVGELVASADTHDDKPVLTYKSINSCIALAHAMHGKHVITVEGLRDVERDNRPHPVQQAMVDAHGSQCGFCTPGFVMSLYGWYQRHQSVPSAEIREADIHEALSGNLCRCTGYQPIIAAAYQSLAMACESHYYQRHETTIVRLLQEIQTDAPDKVSGDAYASPTDLTELTDLLDRHPDAKILAGGTDLNLQITQFAKRFERIIALEGVSALHQLQDRETAIEIGAGVSLETCKPLLLQYFPSARDYVQRFASQQIRHLATVCGNIANASPIGDLPPLLLALNARVICLSKWRGSRDIPLTDFFLDYKQTALQAGECITAVIIPKLQDDEQLFCYKLSKRFEDDISAVSLVVKIALASGQENQQPRHINIAMGGMAATPKRATALEQYLMANWQAVREDNCERDIATAIGDAIVADFTPMSDVRASSAYRLQVAVGLIQKCLLELDGKHIHSVSEYEAVS